MSQFIKSSSKVKADPAYYARKIDQLERQRAALFARCDELDPTGTAPLKGELAAVHHKATMLTPKIIYYGRMLPVAYALWHKANDHKTACNPGGAVTYWQAVPWFSDPKRRK